jgi:hypothetical protein
MDWLMNNRLYLHLMANKEKGFALPLAMLIGLILMVTGMTMMMRAQGDQSKVIAQRARSDAFRSSEVGLARVQDLLNSVRVMATVGSKCTSGDTGDNCWEKAKVPTTDDPSTDLQKNLKRLNIATACDNTSRKDEIANKILAPTTDQRAVSPGLRDLASGEWFEWNDNRYYRMVGYDYGTGRGVLTLEGLSLTSAATDPTNNSDDNAASRNRVVVTIPILPSLPLALNRTTVPALWVSEGATENAGATGEIAVGSADYSGGANFEGDVVMSDTTKATGFDEKTGTLQPELECFISTDKIKQPTPEPNPRYKAQFVPVPFPNLPPIPDKEKHPSRQQKLEITESAIFPREGDVQDSRGVYKYIVKYIDLDVDDDEKITITPGNRVVFYVEGDINGAIEHDCGTTTGCKPGNLQIYAYAPASAKPQICLRGKQRLEAFIFARTYSLGKTDTGAFVGAAWGKNWGKITDCAPPDNTVAVTQTNGVEWTDLPGLKPTPLETLPQLGEIANWCEEPIDTKGTSECVPTP